MEDVGFMACMTLTLLGNYAQTGHFGGPTAYTPFNVAMHLAGPELGGLRYDLRRPKHPFGDKFMMAAGTIGFLWLNLIGAAGVVILAWLLHLVITRDKAGKMKMDG
ncbi:MAG: hypothetical protein EOP49_33340 [Sphingobacteriales bacterium]|nr:MAG: hypothetical protein EOP49_33340 [Sphingobacteriales bacterium]